MMNSWGGHDGAASRGSELGRVQWGDGFRLEPDLSTTRPRRSNAKFNEDVITTNVWSHSSVQHGTRPHDELPMMNCP